MLPLAGVAVPASKLLPEAVLQEIKPKKKYLLHIPRPIPCEQLERFQEFLRARGHNNITVLNGVGIELYEL